MNAVAVIILGHDTGTTPGSMLVHSMFFVLFRSRFDSFRKIYFNFLLTRILKDSRVPRQMVSLWHDRGTTTDLHKLQKPNKINVLL